MVDCVPFLPCSLKNANEGHVTGLTEVSSSGKHRSPLKGLSQLACLGSAFSLGVPCSHMAPRGSETLLTLLSPCHLFLLQENK